MAPASSSRLRLVRDDAPAEAAAPTQGRGEDPRLLDRSKAGDTSAWARLYQDNFPSLLRHVTYMVMDSAVAEDLVQEAFAIAFANIEKYDPRSPFSAWVRGIAHNLVRKHWRKHRRRDRAHARLRSGESAADSRQGPVAARIDLERQADALAEALDQLPGNLREAFVLSDIQELGAAEGAAILGISAGNFRVRASRARARLRELLVDAGVVDAREVRR